MNKLKEKNNVVEKIKSAIIWILFSVSLVSLLIYGLSFFFAKPQIETVTTPPINTNSYLKKTQDVNFHNQHLQHK